MTKWNKLAVEDCIETVATTEKIQRKDFLIAGRFPIVSQEAEFINGYWDDESAVLKLHRPVIVFGDHTQVLKFITFDFVRGADGVKILSPKPFLDPKFFYYALMANPVRTLGYARHYRLLAKAEIQFPQELTEQKRIVAILDEAFEAIAKATANAERNLANARELFETCIEASIDKQRSDHGETILQDLATNITDGDHQPPPKSDTGIPFITISNIDKERHEIDFSDTFLVSETYFHALKDNRRPKEGDVLYSVTGSFGIPVIVPAGRAFCFQRHIGLIRPKDGISSRWLYYVLRSPSLRAQADAGATGTAQRTVSLKLLRSLVVPNTPTDEQLDIAERLDVLNSACQSLIDLHREKVSLLSALKQSLLHKAFSGQLTGKEAIAA